MQFSEEHPVFLTITILEWKRLLAPDKYKDIIVNSLAYFVKEERAFVYAFCIMENHIHLVWQATAGNSNKKNQASFTKYTAQQIKFDLLENHPKVLDEFLVNKKDRKYQFWKRNPLAVELFTPKVLNQKIAYIHNNPVKAGLCKIPEEYKYSSAAFYFTSDNNFEFLTKP